MRFKILGLFFLISLLSGCEDYAVHRTPAKKAVISHTPLATKAEQQFWEALHGGRYQEIPKVAEWLTAAYLENPNDPHLAAHLGFTHIWRVTERQREAKIPASIVNEVILAKEYFSQAYQLNPDDSRILGFLADSELFEGLLFQNERQKVRAYFTLKKAIHAWPQFNYFTAGYPMSTLPPHSERFNEGLMWQWKTLDICAKQKISRSEPNFGPFMKLETQQGLDRACWNSWIAPFNFEGFFLNMGDMLVKNGDWQTAIKIYKNAQLEKNYSRWPYRQMLEKRIAHAKENVNAFQQDQFISADKTILFNSGRGCMICHQAQ